MPELVGKQIGSIGFGLMGFTTRNPVIPDEQAFAALKAALAAGSNFWNAGEFYGSPDCNSNTLLARYFKKYPEDADKVVLSVKGAFSLATMAADCSPEGIKRSIDKILLDLDGTKKIDIFECARVDPKVPIEQTMQTLQREYVDKGIIGGIALSEVSEASVRRAAKVARVVGVEVELSLWSTHILENGVAVACDELGIPIIAYSPVGKGMLTGQIKSLEDLPENDMRRRFPRFHPENFETNMQLVREVQTLAEKKGCTPAQLAICWTKTVAERPGMPLIIPIPGACSESRVQENSTDVTLTKEDTDAIEKILSKVTIVGGRYPAGVPTDG